MSQGKTYQCERCGCEIVEIKHIADAEALATFGVERGTDRDDMVRLCTTCYLLFMTWLKAKYPKTD